MSLACTAALEADAWHLRTGVYTSAGVMGSLAVIWVGRLLFPDYSLNCLDPVAAMAVALLIIKAAYDLTVKSGRDLMDAGLPTEEEVQVSGIIRQHQSDTHGFHDLRTRKAGGFRFVEFHMKVNPQMTVEESHRITDAIAARIEVQFPRTRVTIHAEPCAGNCVGKCLEGCFLQSKGAKQQAIKCVCISVPTGHRKLRCNGSDCSRQNSVCVFRPWSL